MRFLPLVSNECSFQTLSISSLIVLALSFTPLVLQTQQFVTIVAANQSKIKLYLHWLPKLAQAVLGRTPTPTMDQIRNNWTLESKHIFRPDAPMRLFNFCRQSNYSHTARYVFWYSWSVRPGRKVNAMSIGYVVLVRVAPVVCWL